MVLGLLGRGRHCGQGQGHGAHGDHQGQQKQQAQAEGRQADARQGPGVEALHATGGDLQAHQARCQAQTEEVGQHRRQGRHQHHQQLADEQVAATHGQGQEGFQGSALPLARQQVHGGVHGAADSQDHQQQGQEARQAGADGLHGRG